MFDRLSSVFKSLRRLNSLGTSVEVDSLLKELTRLAESGVNLRKLVSLSGSIRNSEDLKVLSEFIYLTESKPQKNQIESTRDQTLAEKLRYLEKNDFFRAPLDQLVYANWNSYSQEGEDLVLSRLLPEKDGFYVDIGAHHPFRFSNTFHFYRRGWKGINIEPSPEGYSLLCNHRSRDINLNVAICSELTVQSGTKIPYYRFEEEALSTTDISRFNQLVQDGFQMKEIIETKTATLSTIFSDYRIEKVDFLSVDCEGFDLEVLRSNNWDKVRPRFILAEVLRQLDNSSTKISTNVPQFLLSKGYKMHSILFNSWIFERV